MVPWFHLYAISYQQYAPIVAMITRITIKRREPFAKGYEFPVTGAYEKLVGKIYGEVDPKNRLNKVIVNLDKAPPNVTDESNTGATFVF